MISDCAMFFSMAQFFCHTALFLDLYAPLCYNIVENCMDFCSGNITDCVTHSGSATIVHNEGSCMSLQLHRPCIISEREKAAVGRSNT